MAGPRDQETRRLRRDALVELASRDYAQLHLARFVEDVAACMAKLGGNGRLRLPPSLAARTHLLRTPSAAVSRLLGQNVVHAGGEVGLGELFDLLLEPLGVNLGAIPLVRHAELRDRGLRDERLPALILGALARSG